MLANHRKSMLPLTSKENVLFDKGKKEIIRVIVSEEQSEIVFEAMYLAGDLDKPGKGIMYLSELDIILRAVS